MTSILMGLLLVVPLTNFVLERDISFDTLVTVAVLEADEL